MSIVNKELKPPRRVPGAIPIGGEESAVGSSVIGTPQRRRRDMLDKGQEGLTAMQIICDALADIEDIFQRCAEISIATAERPDRSEEEMGFFQMELEQLKSAVSEDVEKAVLNGKPLLQGGNMPIVSDADEYSIKCIEIELPSVQEQMENINKIDNTTNDGIREGIKEFRKMAADVKIQRERIEKLLEESENVMGKIDLS